MDKDKRIEQTMEKYSRFLHENGFVVISQERYDDLIQSENQLEHLEACGVDNWENYSHYTCEE